MCFGQGKARLRLVLRETCILILIYRMEILKSMYMKLTNKVSMYMSNLTLRIMVRRA